MDEEKKKEKTNASSIRRISKTSQEEVPHPNAFSFF
jgi:hypothetical protein